MALLKLQKRCSQDTIVVDVGGFLGDFGLSAAAMGCKVIIFEVQPKMVKIIKLSVRLNNFENFVDVRYNAVSEVDGVNCVARINWTRLLFPGIVTAVALGPWMAASCIRTRLYLSASNVSNAVNSAKLFLLPALFTTAQTLPKAPWELFVANISPATSLFLHCPSHNFFFAVTVIQVAVRRRSQFLSIQSSLPL